MSNKWNHNREKTTIKIPPIKLNWSDWISWNTIKNRDVEIPNTPGVYEVRHKNRKKLLTIGRSLNLKKRIRQQLIRGRSHSAGKDICNEEDVSKLAIRWAETERPAAAEEALLIEHFEILGPPEYVKQPPATLRAKERRRSHGK